jgi:GMP synthase (glutamine-hydrolysing)
MFSFLEEKMTLELPLSLCVINGYPKRSRDVLDASQVTQADELYMMFLRRYLPNGRFDVLYVADLDVTLPGGAGLTSYDGFIWTGSNLTIYHDVPEVTRQIELARTIYEAKVPQFGSCWGVQMAATAAGGEVKKNPRGREWAIARDIRLTDDGRNHPLYQGKPAQFDAFIMHLDEVTQLPAGATLLATNDHTEVQALDVRHPAGGVFWATQYHPEFTLYEMARLLIARKRPLTEEGFFNEETEVEQLVDKMITLSQNPDNDALRQDLKINDDILSDTIRQAELRNWLQHLVVPHRQER